MLMYNCSSKLHKHKQKLHIAYLTSWHNSTFGYKLRTIEAKNAKKVKNSQPQLRIYWLLYKKKCNESMIHGIAILITDKNYINE